MQRSLEPPPTARRPRCQGQKAMAFTAAWSSHLCFARVAGMVKALEERSMVCLVLKRDWAGETGASAASKIFLRSYRWHELSLPPLANHSPSDDHASPQIC